MTITAWFNNWIENIKGDRTSAIFQTRVALYCMFADAVENDIILKNPVTKAVKYNIGKEPKKVRALTIDEQNKEFVFFYRKGEPTKNSAYDKCLFLRATSQVAA